MSIDLSVLEKRILFKCQKELLSKTYMSSLYRDYDLKKREAAIEHLIKLKFINKKEIMKPGANKIPVYYDITDNGEKWLKDYEATLPE